MRAYEYRHVVGFEETNVLGNVYYVSHLSWQGRCREMFLRDHVPGTLDELANGLYLVTSRCSCEYLAELRAFDEVAVRMRLADLAQNRLTLSFEYWKRNGSAEELVARGEQQILVMKRQGEQVVPSQIPAALRDALRPYSETVAG
jgi:enediyne biosynthesis thioesterase